MANKKGLSFLKKTDFYSKNITQQYTVHDLLCQTNNPIATAWKSHIIQMAFSEPYWDNDIATQAEVTYGYPVSAEEPNCFTEAIERNAAMISFPHEDFLEKTFVCCRNEIQKSVLNILDISQLLLAYLEVHKKEIRYVMEKYPYPNRRRVELAVIEGKCYAEEALLENDLTYEDYSKIIKGIPNLSDSLLNGQKSHLWDSFGNGLFEYRLNVSSNRIFRLFFIQKETSFIFLNGFIKKTQTTPSQELVKAKWIKERIV